MGIAQLLSVNLDAIPLQSPSWSRQGVPNAQRTPLKEAGTAVCALFSQVPFTGV
jgi:hypothetical protein